MKISTFITFLFVVSGTIFIMALAINEGAQKYDVPINNSLWENSTQDLNNVTAKSDTIRDSFEKINDPKAGWLEIGLSGFTGIVSAVTLVPSVLFASFGLGGGLITNILGSMNIPVTIILLVIAMFTVWGLFKLIEFFQRWNL